MNKPKPNQLKLSIRKIHSTCDIQLSYLGNNIADSIQLDYPESLILTYQRWRHAYFNYYRRPRIKAHSVTIQTSLEESRSSLTTAHLELITAFQEEWLDRLGKIRTKIIKIVNHSSLTNFDLLIACNSNELARLPWEIWDIGCELNNNKKITISRKNQTQ